MSRRPGRAAREHGTPRVTLRKRLSRAVRQGHPWLYGDAVSVPQGLPTGTIVEVREPGGAFVGRGLYDADSPLAVRVWTIEERERINDDLIKRRVREAWNLRQAVIDMESTTAYRLLHGEGDRLPGVVCDVYGSVAVLQQDTAAVGHLLPAVVDAVRELVPTLDCAVLRPSRAAGAEAPLRALYGTPPAAPLQVREHGLVYEVDIARGHKTGLYLDQRENRELVRRLATGRRVLNLFAYTGGFSVAAAVGGATRVVSVDVGRPLMAAARRNFALNELAQDGHEFVVADAFEHLTGANEDFDLLVVDPPSMAPSAAALPGALRAYCRLNTLALRRADARRAVGDVQLLQPRHGRPPSGGVAGRGSGRTAHGAGSGGARCGAGSPGACRLSGGAIPARAGGAHHVRCLPAWWDTAGGDTGRCGGTALAGCASTAPRSARGMPSAGGLAPLRQQKVPGSDVGDRPASSSEHMASARCLASCLAAAGAAARIACLASPVGVRFDPRSRGGGGPGPVSS